MRIDRIRATNFLCHEEVDIDLDGLSLFAITGPTGAGKTALTDVITCALFGQIPRVGKLGVKEFIRHGTTSAEVELEFSLPDGRAFRASRTIREKAGARAKLMELDPVTREVRETLAQKVKDTDAAVEELIGLDYATFVTSVLLPQGQFSQFLHCEPRDRLDILKRLLNLGYLDRLRDRAAFRERRAADRVRGLENELAGKAWQDATPQHLDATADELNTARADGEGLADRVTELAQLVADDNTVLALVKDLATAESRATELAAHTDDVARLEDRISAAERAASVTPLLDWADEAERAASQAGAVVTNASATHADAQRRLAEVEAGLAERQPDLERALAAARESLAELKTLDRVADELAKAEATRERRAGEHEAAGAELARQQRTLADLVESLRELHDREQSLASQLELVQPDEYPLPQLLDAAADALGRFEDAAGHWSRARASLERLRAETGNDATAVADLQARMDEAQVAFESARADAMAAEAASRAAQRAHAAHALRCDLQPGDACPVCRAEVDADALRDDASDVDLAALEADVDSTRERVEHARTAVQEASIAHGQAVVRHQQREHRLAELTADEQRLRTRLDEEAALVAERLAAAGQDASAFAADDTPPAELVRATRHALREARRDADAWHAARERLQKDLEQATREREHREQSVPAEEKLTAQLATRVEHLDTALAEIDTDLASLRDRIHAVTGGRSVAEQRATLTADADRHAAALDTLRSQADDARRAAERAQDAMTAATANRHQATSAATERRQQADRALTTHGFASGDDARAAAVAADTLAEWRCQRDEWNRESRQIRGRIDHLREQLGDRTCDPEDAAARARNLDELRATRDELTGRIARLAADCERIESLISEAADKRQQLARARADARTWEGIARDLQSNRLPKWIVEQTLQDLAARASRQLRALTDRRYDLLAEGSDFRVIDRFNAGEERSVRTLSGGETFLVSLALALALADSIRTMAGGVGVELGCLFLDEGFGSLDPESVDLALTALEALEARGRQIGVISHIDDLAQRMPGRIHLERGPRQRTAAVHVTV